MVNPDTQCKGKKQSAHSNSNFLDILTPLPSTPSMRKGDDGDGEKNGKNRGGGINLLDHVDQIKLVDQEDFIKLIRSW